MFDAFVMIVPLGWILLAAGVVGALVIATENASPVSDLQPQIATRRGANQEFRPTARWSLVALCLLLAACGALKISQDNDWSLFQKPHLSLPSSAQ